MLSVEELLKSQIQDEHGNIHLFFDGRLVASFLSRATLNGYVTLEIVPDEKWEKVKIEGVYPTVVVYQPPVQVKDKFSAWVSGLSAFEGFWVIAAVNGLAFCSDLFPFGWSLPDLPTLMSSELEMDGYIDARHELARDLIVHFTQHDWDEQFVAKRRFPDSHSFSWSSLTQGKGK